MFLTLEDPRARVQGSRDPLGVQPVWARFGRHVVANLTTVSNSVRGFTILALGRYFTERVIDKGVASEKDAISIFLRMEQIGAYARHVGHGVAGDIRGIERVKGFVEKYKSSIPIGDSSAAMILSDQKTYGLWGLFSTSARVSGIIVDGPVGLTPDARAFVEENYVPKLRPVESKLLRLLSKNGHLNTRKTDPLFRCLVGVLPESFSKSETAYFGEVLRDGGRVDAGRVNDPPPLGRQAIFARLLREYTDLDAWTNRAEVLKLARAARHKDEGLAIRLEKIARLEALLATAETVFGYLQARDGQLPSDLARKLSDHWGNQVPNLPRDEFEQLVPEITEIVGKDMAALMNRCDAALAAGEYEETIHVLLEWNKLVMAARKAAPWIRLSSGKLDVRYRGQERELPDGDQLADLWWNSYFIDSLKNITRQLEAA